MISNLVLEMSHITAAGNTEVPAFLALGQLGYEVERRHLDSDTELWIARQGDTEFSASSPLEVLGLCLMKQTRGENWKAQNDEIESYLRKFYPEALPADEEE